MKKILKLAGPVMRSGGEEAPSPTNLWGWWAARNYYGPGSWSDKSGKGHHLTQAVAGSQPTGLANAVVLDGTDDFLNLDAPNLLEYGPNLILNGGFETYSGTPDDGTNDTISSWDNYGQALGKFEISATAHGGSAALKITRTTQNGGAKQAFAVTPGARYGLLFWTRGDGVNAGRFRIKDITNNSDIRTITTTGITGVDYTIYIYQFTAPAGCVSCQVEFWANTVDNNYAYFDDVVVHELYDLSGSFWVYRSGAVDVERQYLVNRMKDEDQRCWHTRFFGTGEGDDPSAGKFGFGLTRVGTNIGCSVKTNGVIPTATWTHVGWSYQVVGNGTSVIKLYVNGAADNHAENMYSPIWYNPATPLRFGATFVPLNEHYFAGYLDEVVLWNRLLTDAEMLSEYQRRLAQHI